MNIINIGLFVCLLAVVPAFAGVSHEGLQDHLQHKRSLDYQGDVSAVQRSPREISEDLKTGIQSKFNIDNILKIAQTSLRIALKIFQTLTGYFPSTAIRQGIEQIGFPGSAAVATLVGHTIDFANELANGVANSEFVSGEPTRENFLVLLSDTAVLSLQRGRHLNAELLATAKKAFKEGHGTKYDILDNIKLSPFGDKLLKAFHKFSKDFAKGLAQITGKTIAETIYKFIQTSSLPFAEEFATITKGIITTVHKMNAEISAASFLKHSADIKNLNKFIITVAKAVTINSLEESEEVLKVLLSVISKVSGKSIVIKDIKSSPLALPDGVAIKAVNKVLEFLVKMDADEVMRWIHETISFTGKLVYEITNDKGVKNIPEVIRFIGKHLTELGANAASYIIKKSNQLAILSNKSEFVKDPTWENLQTYVLDSTKNTIDVLIECTDYIRKYFDDNFKKVIIKPGIVQDIVKALIPLEALSKIQEVIKSIVTGVASITGELPQAAIKGFISSSSMPFRQQLTEIVHKILHAINENAQLIAKSKFLSESPTVENAAISLIEIAKSGITSWLKVLSEVLKIINTVFQ